MVNTFIEQNWQDYIPSQQGPRIVSLMFAQLDGVIMVAIPTNIYSRSEYKCDKCNTSFENSKTQSFVKYGDFDSPFNLKPGREITLKSLITKVNV